MAKYPQAAYAQSEQNRRLQQAIHNALIAIFPECNVQPHNIQLSIEKLDPAALNIKVSGTFQVTALDKKTPQ